MVVRYEHMWISIPLNLVIVLFVVLMMGLTKLWMFNVPKRERHRPVYSLWINKQLPPDKPVPKKGYNPYYGQTRGGHTGRLPPKPGAGVATGAAMQHASVAAAGAVHNAPHKYNGQRQMYKPAPNYPAPAYQQSGYGGPQAGYQGGPRAGYQGQQAGYQGQQAGYQGQQAGFQGGPQGGYPGQQAGYQGGPQQRYPSQGSYNDRGRFL